MGNRGAMVTTWGAGRPTVEPAKGMEVFGRALGWYDELAKEGRITGYRVYGRTTSTGGMIVAEGDTTELSKILTEERATTMLGLASAVVEDVHTEVCIGGSPDDVTGYYTKMLEELTAFGVTG